jgi:endonuclease/exonuclease/phosphatase family metal-dependent hydrolase
MHHVPIFLGLLAVLLTSACELTCADTFDDLIQPPPGRLIEAAAKAEPAPPLCLMSYNIRHIHNPPPHHWPARLPRLAAVIEKHGPDLIGMQEAMYVQIKDLLTALPAYDWIGLGRDGGSRGEFMAVFYRNDRLEPLEFDHFWLSDTPRLIASSTWGNANRRMVTWVLFRERATGQIFYLLNTHFDHQSREARQKSAFLVRKAIADIPDEVPIILMGDFNATAGKSDPYTILTEQTRLTDSWVDAPERFGETLNTFNGFREGRHEGGNRIDWILYAGPIHPLRTGIDDFTMDGHFPSDHFPILTTFDYGVAP